MTVSEEVSYGLSQAMEYNPTSGRDFADLTILAGWFVPAESWDDRAGIWLVEFKDGARFAMIGGHDSTGWDCRSNLDLHPFEKWEEQLTAYYSEYTHRASLTEIVTSIKAQLAARTPLDGGRQ